MDKRIEELKKNIFHSADKKEWKDKEAWIRRALFWKLMCLGLMSKPDQQLHKYYLNALDADQVRAPTDDELKPIANICITKYNEINEKPKSKIIIPGQEKPILPKIII